MFDKVFITGGSGFIGSNLVNKLTNISQVYSLVRMPIEYVNRKVTVVVGDILKPEGFLSAIKECDVIFHCAAFISFQKKDFQKSYKVNVEGTRAILDLAYRSGVKKVVYLSACTVLGYSKNKEETIDENNSPLITKDNVYAYTKKLAEEEVQKYVEKGLDVSIANLATVYGAGDRKMNSGSIIKMIYDNKIKLAPPGGTSYVTTDDLVDGLMLLARNGKRGERYIFCNENLTFLELFNRIAKVVGRNKIKFIIPRWTYIPALMLTYVKNIISHNDDKKINLLTPQIIKELYYYKYFSSRKARDELGWCPTASLEKAVEQALQYYIKEGLIS